MRNLKSVALVSNKICIAGSWKWLSLLKIIKCSKQKWMCQALLFIFCILGWVESFFLHSNLSFSFNTEKILLYYQTFQVHVPEVKSKKTSKKSYVETKERQKPQEMLESKEEELQHQKPKWT